MIQVTCQKCRKVFPDNRTLYDDWWGDLCVGCAEWLQTNPQVQQPWRRKP